MCVAHLHQVLHQDRIHKQCNIVLQPHCRIAFEESYCSIDLVLMAWLMLMFECCGAETTCCLTGRALVSEAAALDEVTRTLNPNPNPLGP